MSVELLNIDCMEYMAGLPDKAFDLAIVDPPYGIGEDGRKNHTRGKLAKARNYSKNVKYDCFKPDRAYFTELKRVSKNQIIWGANHFGEMPGSSGWVVWDKNNGNNDFADCELAYTSFDKAVRKFKHTWNGMLQENMAGKEDRIHPNQKPVRLYRWLILYYATVGDKILDTHMGSGSSAIAAFQTGFDYVGCEIDKHYYDAACKRFKEQTAQQNLFT